MGAKEGFVHLMWVLLEPGDAALVPSPSYPIHIHGPMLAGASVFQVPMGPDEDLFANLEEAWERARPRPRVIVLSFPHNPTTATVDLEVMERVVAFARRARRRRRARLRVRRPRVRRLRAAVDPPGAGGRRGRRRALHPDEVVLDGRLAGRVPVRQRASRRRPRAAQVLARLRHVPADPDRRDHGDERGAGHAEGGRRGLPVAPRRALRRAGPRRLGGPAAAGDDVRVGARCRSRSPSSARSASPSSSPARACRRLARASASGRAARASSASRSSRTSTGSARPCAGSATVLAGGARRRSRLRSQRPTCSGGAGHGSPSPERLGRTPRSPSGLPAT